MNQNLPVVVAPDGRGQRGFCKICASSLSNEINNKFKKGWTVARIMRWMKEMDFVVARHTMYAHRDHLKDPKTTFVEEARKNPIIKSVTNREFLESIRDVAASKIKDVPDIVTVEHGLKAAQIMLQDKKGMEGITLVLMKVFTNRASEVIEGEYREVTDSG